MMERAMVIGCPGAGKSTFAKRLHEVTGLPLYYLDMLWHKPDRTNIPREEFDARLEEIVRKDKWIIDGNYQRTLELRLKECDTVFLLDYPLEVCLAGAQSRIGKRREDLPWKRSLTRSLSSGSKDFLRKSCRESTNCWRSMKVRRIL